MEEGSKCLSLQIVLLTRGSSCVINNVNFLSPKENNKIVRARDGCLFSFAPDL